MNNKKICPWCHLGNTNKVHVDCEQKMELEVEEANMLSGITIEGGEING